MNGLLKYDYPVAESTGVATENIDAMLDQNLAETMVDRYETQGTIGPVPEDWQEYRKNIFGKHVPPFTDEDLLNLAMGSASSAPMHVLRRGVGRVATNLMEPANYSIIDKMKNLWQSIKNVDPTLQVPFKGGLKRAVKAVIKDKPLKNVIRTERDLPYRLMFDMKPRYSGAYKDIPRSYEAAGSPFNIVRQVEFNPKTVAGKNMLDYVRKDTPNSFFYNLSHPVMGGYKRTTSKDKMIHYEDLWDLGMNKGEAKQLYELFKFRKKQFGKHLKPASTGGPVDEVGSYVLRKLAESITNPVLIKGSVKP